MSGFTWWWDAIAALDITRTEKAVLTSLARHADWDSGASSHPAVATIGREASLQDRAVQRTLRSLECATDCGDRRCHHRGLIALAAPATRYRPSTYRLLLRRPEQGQFDEVGMRRARPTSPYDANVDWGYDRYGHVYNPDEDSRERRRALIEAALAKKRSGVSMGT